MCITAVTVSLADNDPELAFSESKEWALSWRVAVDHKTWDLIHNYLEHSFSSVLIEGGELVFDEWRTVGIHRSFRKGFQYASAMARTLGAALGDGYSWREIEVLPGLPPQLARDLGRRWKPGQEESAVFRSRSGEGSIWVCELTGWVFVVVPVDDRKDAVDALSGAGVEPKVQKMTAYGHDYCVVAAHAAWTDVGPSVISLGQDFSVV